MTVENTKCALNTSSNTTKHVRRVRTEVRNSRCHQNTAVQATMCKTSLFKYVYLCMRSDHYICQQQPAGADGTSDRHVLTKPVTEVYYATAIASSSSEHNCRN